MTHKVLIVSGHPALEHGSTANKAIIDAYRALDPSVKVRDLGALYPDFKIDVKAEQNALEHVFAQGFAYGTGGDKLKNRVMLLSCTTGSPKEAYTPQGHNRNSMEFYLNNYEQTAFMCGMKYARPLISYGMLYIPGVMDEKAKQAVIEKAWEHAKALKAEIDAL